MTTWTSDELARIGEADELQIAARRRDSGRCVRGASLPHRKRARLYVLRVHFSGDNLRLEIEPNVSWESTAVTTVTGHAAG